MDCGEGNPCAKCVKNHHTPPASLHLDRYLTWIVARATPAPNASKVTTLHLLLSTFRRCHHCARSSINLTQALWTLNPFIVELDMSTAAELHQSPPQPTQLLSLPPHHPPATQLP